MIVPASRTYSGAKDLRSMIDLLVAVRPVDRITDYPSIVDLREVLVLSSVQDNTRLWFDADGRIVGFAFVDPYNNLRFEIDRRAAHPDTELEIISWGVECVQRAMQKGAEPCALDTSCRDDDGERIALLERHGFVRQEIRSLHMVRSLHEPIPAPQVPAGFCIRHVAGEQEVEALVALHRAAFGTEHMTVEERLAMMRVPEYDAEMDLLVVAPDGRFAANCLCSISREENERTGRREGYTDPVMTHPDFQRRGLARALLLAGFRKLRQRGMDTAVLGTSSENMAMQRTAQAVGFRLRSTTIWFAKVIEFDSPNPLWYNYFRGNLLGGSPSKRNIMPAGWRWVVRDRYGNSIYLTQERWEHISEPMNHPEMSAYENHLKEAIQSGRRKQDPLNPQKYRYIKAFDGLAEDNTHIIAIVLFRFSEGPKGEPIANNYVVTAYQKEIG